MKSAIKAVDSSLRLILTVIELFVSVAFLLKLFGSDSFSEGGLIDYVSEILGIMSSGALFFPNNIDLAGPVTFLLLVLGFMFFSIALFKLAPYMLRKQEEDRD